MANNYRIATGDGRFLTLLTVGGPVTAQVDNPAALNQIWNIPTYDGHNSTVQNLGFQVPMPFAAADGPAIIGNIAPIAWNFVDAGGNNYLQQVATGLTWRAAPGNGGVVTLVAANLADPAQQMAITPA
ncbi:hypothetical protein PAXRUDRAFT_833170 [Paxillus rubicundulus Ve08.2h10]|uniref:Unplaced genomic scaffold scaffold_1064, whole genome shotgun sequence n=1 Tax=Paxillus rubicundulus Ve08.2h10 TaxID=930991 RepID=A0A0D0CZD1_9AGAM|nr:hypothetical protein PAXRUDRAFT_833170 [Paxillus rubicundulus Ve08.2h10]